MKVKIRLSHTLLAKVAGSDAYVVIENQMEDADNDHLAALLNYAAHSDSEILIWVAGGFSLRYRRTIDWLNSSTGLRIYGVKMSAWRNGETIERRLNPIVGPNQRVEWPKYGYPAINQKYNTFFRPLVADLWAIGISDRKMSGVSNDQVFPSGFAGIEYHVGFWHSFGGRPSLDVYLWIATPDQERNKEIFDALDRHRKEIEKELPGVSWDRRDHQRMCSIYFVTRGSIGDRDEKLAELQRWALDLVPNFKAAFQPRLEKVMREMAPEGD